MFRVATSPLGRRTEFGSHIRPHHETNNLQRFSKAPMHTVKLKILIDAKTLQGRVRELAEQISRDYAGRQLHLVCILKGACIFLADLVRQLDLDVSLDFMAVSSYGASQQSSGEVRIVKDLDSRLQDRDVLIVEDILDTGITLDYLFRNLKARCPRSLEMVTLLSKPSRRLKEVKATYVGFEIPDKFVVGYGLDFAEKYRHLPFIGVIENEIG
jgi:hypoxanthine phosphoribosyltransferase